jgi:hypothetical protein
LKEPPDASRSHPPPRRRSLAAARLDRAGRFHSLEVFLDAQPRHGLLGHLGPQLHRPDRGVAAVAGPAANETDVVATNLRPVSDADPENPATFTDKGYTLTLFLLDVQSGASGTMDFTGLLNGTISEFTAMVRNQFTGQTTQQLILGDNLYEVSIGPYTPPGPPEASNLGSIGAHARVTVTALHKTPEPSTLLLALLGGPIVGYRVWRRRVSPTR